MSDRETASAKIELASVVTCNSRGCRSGIYLRTEFIVQLVSSCTVMNLIFFFLSKVSTSRDQNRGFENRILGKTSRGNSHFTKESSRAESHGTAHDGSEAAGNEHTSGDAQCDKMTKPGVEPAREHSPAGNRLFAHRKQCGILGLRASGQQDSGDMKVESANNSRLFEETSQTDDKQTCTASTNSFSFAASSAVGSSSCVARSDEKTDVGKSNENSASSSSCAASSSASASASASAASSSSTSSSASSSASSGNSSSALEDDEGGKQNSDKIVRPRGLRAPPGLGPSTSGDETADRVAAQQNFAGFNPAAFMQAGAPGMVGGPPQSNLLAGALSTMVASTMLQQSADSTNNTNLNSGALLNSGNVDAANSFMDMYARIQGVQQVVAAATQQQGSSTAQNNPVALMLQAAAMQQVANTLKSQAESGNLLQDSPEPVTGSSSSERRDDSKVLHSPQAKAVDSSFLDNFARGDEDEASRKLRKRKKGGIQTENLYGSVLKEVMYIRDCSCF